MEYFVFYGELILAIVKATLCANQNIHGALLHAANRFICRSGYGVKIFLVVIYNNVEVKIAVGVRGTVGKRAKQINANRLDLIDKLLLYDFNLVNGHRTHYSHEQNARNAVIAMVPGHG